MSANIQIKCPVAECTFETGLRFDPGPDNDHPNLAEQELKKEHPNHTGNSWRFKNYRTLND